MYSCPRCNTGLIQTREPDGVSYQCPACGGKAIGFPLLRREIGPDAAKLIWGGQFGPTATTGCRCPICSQAMTQETVRMPKGDVTIDVCMPCSFVWFDKGEAELLPDEPPPPPKPLGEIDRSLLTEDQVETLAMARAKQISDRDRTTNPQPDEDWKTVPGILGLPVEMDEDAKATGTAVATWLTAFLIAVVSIGAFYNLDPIVKQYGFLPSQPWRLSGLTFITSFFLHAGFWHLASNLYFLVVFGRSIERHIGAARWLLVLVVATLAGNVMDILVNSSSHVPSIGASGGISGILAYYAFSNPNARLGLMMRYFFQYQWIEIPAWLCFVAWIGLQFLGAGEQLAGVGNVDSLAHLGGVFAGIFFWVIWRNDPGAAPPVDQRPGQLPVKIK